jgi:hypothetical protein
VCASGLHKRSATMLAQFFPAEAKALLVGRYPDPVARATKARKLKWAPPVMVAEEQEVMEYTQEVPRP